MRWHVWCCPNSAAHHGCYASFAKHWQNNQLQGRDRRLSRLPVLIGGYMRIELMDLHPAHGIENQKPCIGLMLCHAVQAVQSSPQQPGHAPQGARRLLVYSQSAAVSKQGISYDMSVALQTQTCKYQTTDAKKQSTVPSCREQGLGHVDLSVDRGNDGASPVDKNSSALCRCGARPTRCFCCAAAGLPHIQLLALNSFAITCVKHKLFWVTYCKSSTLERCRATELWRRRSHGCRPGQQTLTRYRHLLTQSMQRCLPTAAASTSLFARPLGGCPILTH